MTKQQSAVLARLMFYGIFGTTADSIARDINAPEASIRRAIQELIRQGYNVSYAADGIYRYRDGY